MKRGVLVAAGLGALALGIVVVVAGGGEAPGAPQEWKGGAPPEALAVGPASDPEIAALLTEMRDEFASAGVNLTWITPEEVTLLHKKGYAGQHAIPPRSYWPRMVQTILQVFQPAREEFGGPIKITNGYRPAWYNLLVTKTKKKPQGTIGSRHQWFEALDVVPVEGGAGPRLKLARILARMYVWQGKRLRMGLGIYPPSEWPGGFHFDTGSQWRKWANTAYWLNAVSNA